MQFTDSFSDVNVHATILEISQQALIHNLQQYKSLLQPETRIMAMVKANGYGSDITKVANLLEGKVEYLGVAYVSEGILLRKEGITAPIMVMNPHVKSFAQFEKYNLQPEIYSFEQLQRLIRDTTKHLPIHLKIDTGMQRLGFSKKEIPLLIEELKKSPRLKIEGILTHFASAENEHDDDFTISQAALFEDACNNISKAFGYHPIRHACNSSSIVRWSQYHYEMVRLGIGLHGYDPVGQLDLTPTSNLKTVISQIREVPRAGTVGYSRQGKLSRDIQIAILPLGYGDGYLRVFGKGNAKVSINGHLVPTVGNICMDMTMVDVTGIDAREGDKAIIFGDNPSIRHLAEWADTIPYEILTNISSRVKRVIVG